MYPYGGSFRGTMCTQTWRVRFVAALRVYSRSFTSAAAGKELKRNSPPVYGPFTGRLALRLYSSFLRSTSRPAAHLTDALPAGARKLSAQVAPTVDLCFSNRQKRAARCEFQSKRFEYQNTTSVSPCFSTGSANGKQAKQTARATSIAVDYSVLAAGDCVSNDDPRRNRLRTNVRRQRHLSEDVGNLFFFFLLFLHKRPNEQEIA